MCGCILNAPLRCSLRWWSRCCPAPRPTEVRLSLDQCNWLILVLIRLLLDHATQRMLLAVTIRAIVDRVNKPKWRWCQQWPPKRPWSMCRLCIDDLHIYRCGWNRSSPNFSTFSRLQHWNRSPLRSLAMPMAVLRMYRSSLAMLTPYEWRSIVSAGFDHILSMRRPFQTNYRSFTRPRRIDETTKNLHTVRLFFKQHVMQWRSLFWFGRSVYMRKIFPAHSVVCILFCSARKCQYCQIDGAAVLNSHLSKLLLATENEKQEIHRNYFVCLFKFLRKKCLWVSLNFFNGQWYGILSIMCHDWALLRFGIE